MKKYKILTKEMTGSFQKSFNYKLGVEYICHDFDDSNISCSRGFYATDIDGLIYTNLSNQKRVFECEVSGKEKIFDKYKQRFENIEIVREIPIDELKQLVKNQSDKMDWDYYSALFPFNPFLIEPTITIEEAQRLLEEWISVYNFVGTSAYDSVWSSVYASVRESVWNSVYDSVYGFVYGFMYGSARIYMGSLFPGIKKWKNINHEVGTYPFQPCVDLWNNGVIPVKIDEDWKLYYKNGEYK
jgi:hypothetical protein